MVRKKEFIRISISHDLDNCRVGHLFRHHKNILKTLDRLDVLIKAWPGNTDEIPNKHSRLIVLSADSSTVVLKPTK